MGAPTGPVGWTGEHHAMACEFGLELWGSDFVHLRDVGQECFDLLDGLEAQLSAYLPCSDICWINAEAARTPVRVDPELFDLLLTCQRLHSETGGAFDITTGPLTRCWGFYQREGRVPEPEALAEAMQSVGMGHVVLDPRERSVGFDRQGVEVNLGGVGKGYALGRLMDLLGQYEVDAALAHSGGSTIAVLGAPPEQRSWRVGIVHPGPEPRRLGSVCLRDRAFATSGSTEQFFVHEGRRLGHILDPRSGAPVEAVWCNWVTASSPVEADALSTAFFVLGPEGTAAYRSHHRDAAALFVLQAPHEIVDLGLSAEMEEACL